MEMLMRETLTLHKVLSKYLPQQAVEVRDSTHMEHGKATGSNPNV